MEEKTGGMVESTLGVRLAYRMRVYPTGRQERLLAQLLGAGRYVWNWALALRNEAWKQRRERLNWAALSNRLTAARRQPELSWLLALPREPFNGVLRDLERAFTNYFAKRAAAPRFKSKGGRESVRFTLDQRRQQVVQLNARWVLLKLPGVGALRVRRTRALVGRFRSVTVSKDAAGRWFASIYADSVPAPRLPDFNERVVGVDLGIREMMVIVGEGGVRRVEAPKALAARLKRLRRYQRRHSRQLAAQRRSHGAGRGLKGADLAQASSKRRQRTRRCIGKLYAAIADSRRDALHKASTDLVREASVIGLEDLAVKAMTRSMGNRAFRRNVADAALGELRRQVAYKSAWFGRTLVLIDQWFPSSKRCSECGNVNRRLLMRQKNWTCPTCSATHDRDVNAATNIRIEALRIIAASSPATPRSGESEAHGEDRVESGRSIARIVHPSSNCEFVKAPTEPLLAATPDEGRSRGKPSGNSESRDTISSLPGVGPALHSSSLR